MTLLIERELAALAHHQNVSELRGADGRRGTSPFADLLIRVDLLAGPKNRSEREQPRIRVEHDASIDLRDAFEHRRRKVGRARLLQQVMEPILGACSLSPPGFQQVQRAHNLASVPSVFEHDKHPSAAVLSEVKTRGKKPSGQLFPSDSSLPRFIFRDRVCKMPASVEEIE